MNILIVAPHADDEVLGCGGMIARRRREGHDVRVVVASNGDVTRLGVPKASAAARMTQMQEAAQILGIAVPDVLFPGAENKLDSVPILDVVSRLDQVVVQTDWDQVFIPYPSHHQDHRVVHDACLSALRPRGRRGPCLIALYEYAYVGATPLPGGRYYVDVTDTFETKRAAFAAYATEACAAPHPLSFEAMETLARMRGIEAGAALAELFYVLKMVDPAA
ncbi:MAG: PIG-L deacetylase family protein [Acidobacteriota bacterium]